jgi:hypothetical protein
VSAPASLPRRAVTVAVSAALLAAGLVGLSAAPASASVTPAWQPDANAVGSLSFYDAAGHVITSGSITSTPMAAYYRASGGAVSAGDNVASVATTTPETGNSATWSGTQSSTSNQAFPASSLPGDLAGVTDPVVHDDSAASFTTNQITPFPNSSTTAGYQNLYEVRIYTAGSSNSYSATHWYAADIQVDTNAHTWAQVYPAVVVATSSTTTLAASPSTQAYVGQSVTLTATVSPSGAAGSVQFKDGATDIGSPVAVSSGQAVHPALLPDAGTHSYSAAFVPTDATAYSASASSTMSYKVIPAPSWKPVIYGTVRVGSTPACVAGFNDATSVTYAWYHNGTAISGATASTYKIAEGYYAQALTCRVTATNPAGSTSALSSPVTIAIGPALVATTKPYLYGNHVHGQYEYANHGVWKPAATSYTYQWYVGTTKISGATSYRYLVPLADKGKTLNCVVTARRTYWTAGAYRTAAVKITA